MYSTTRILLIEDNPGDQRLISELLRETEFATAQLSIAPSIQHASELAHDGVNFVLVLLDLHLPDSNGLESVKTVRRIFPESALVVLTGFEDQSMASLTAREGAQNYILKTELSPQFIERTIRACIERHTILHDLKSTNEELLRSQYLLDKAQENGEVGFWSITFTDKPQWTISGGCRRIYGVDETFTVNSIDDFLSCTHQDDVQSLRTALSNAITRLENVDCTHRVVGKDGVLRWVQTHAVHAAEILGAPRQIIGVMHDITQLKKAAEYLERQEELFRIIGQNASDIITLYDPEGKATFVSEAVRAVLGYEPESLIGMHWTELIHPEEREEVSQFVDELIQNKEYKNSISFRTRCLDGEYIWCETSLRPIAHPSETSMYVSVTRDVTERKAAEEQVRLFSRAVDQSADMIFFCSVNRTIIYANEESAKRLGFSRSHFLSQDLIELGTAQYHENLRSAFARAYSTGTARTEIEVMTAQGEVVPVDCTMSTIVNDQGEISGILCDVHDITERKRVEQQLREFNRILEARVHEHTIELHEALEKEKELGEMKNRFMSMVSHEFRTPLTVILSSNELLQRYYDRMNEAQRTDHFRTIQAEISHLVEMLNDVLTVGRVDSGRVQYEPSNVDLAEFLHELELKMRAIDTDSHALVFSNSANVTSLFVDRVLMMHVMSNLLGNALKYSPAGSSVELDISRDEHSVVLSVRDHGMGIPADDLPHLFEAFHRAKNVGTIQGTGLGLAIVKDYVRMHGGNVVVSSTIGKGSTFTVYIPESIPVSINSKALT